jgi:Domain of unknown function (DUF6908)
MKTYQQFARRLAELLGDSQAVRITVPGFMPLTIEEILPSAEGHRQISLTHYGKQNGDLMRDPEIVFELHDWGQDGIFAEPVYFRNDYAGVESFVYATREEPSGVTVKLVNPRLKRELKSFARMWFRNLREQGFFDRDATREVLS